MLPERYNFYVEEWCKNVGIPCPDVNTGAWNLIAHMVAKRSYQTAVAFMFQLGWAEYRDYLIPASKSLQQYCEQYKNVTMSPADLYTWLDWYQKENPPPEA